MVLERVVGDDRHRPAVPPAAAAARLLAIAAAIAGFVVATRGQARAILGGLALGYVVYALAFAAYTASHPYYALPLLPILALACGALAGFVLDHLDTPRVATLSATSLLVLIVGVGAYKSRPSGADTAAIAAYRRIGAVTHHTTHAIIVDERLRAPAMYHGWIAGHYWYPPTPGQDLPAAGDPFPPWIEPAQASYLVIVDVSELRSERRLRAFVRDLPVVADTSRYAVFAPRRSCGRCRRADGSPGLTWRRRSTAATAARRLRRSSRTGGTGNRARRAPRRRGPRRLRLSSCLRTPRRRGSGRHRRET